MIVVLALLGSLSALSASSLSQVQMAGMSLFDLFDSLSSKLLMPLCGLLTCIFIARRWGREAFVQANSNQGALSNSGSAAPGVLGCYADYAGADCGGDGGGVAGVKVSQSPRPSRESVKPEPSTTVPAPPMPNADHDWSALDWSRACKHARIPRGIKSPRSRWSASWRACFPEWQRLLAHTPCSCHLHRRTNCRLRLSHSTVGFCVVAPPPNFNVHAGEVPSRPGK